MATNRFGYSDDFVLKNGKVGINTAEPQETLDVVGSIKATNIKTTGISSFTTYEGFLEANHNISENLDLTSGTSGSLSGEIIVGTGVTATVGSAATSSQGNIDSLKVYNTFTVPTGGTEDRPSKVKPGQLYYNVDFKTIEFWDGNVWRQVDNTTQSGRGVIAGGTTNVPASSTIISTINYINISSTGNSLDFGNLTSNGSQASSASSSTRGIFAGRVGVAPTFTASNIIDYITIASQGNAIDFGDLPTATRAMSQGASSSTRGIFAGGVSPGNTNVINYVTISTIGNALDFGDLIDASYGNSATSSPTRGVWGGDSVYNKRLQYVTISSTGNAIRFGDLTFSTSDGGAIGNSVRGIYGGMDVLLTKSLSYITIATMGNSVEFGEMTGGTFGRTFRGCSTQIRGVLTGGSSAPTQVNIIDYITIASAGNAQDFGDLNTPLQQHATCSDSHGGLGGF